MKVVFRYVFLLALTAFISYGLSSIPEAVAQEASSSSYKVDEIFFGPGGSNDVSSSNYQGRASIGDTGIGSTSSASNQTYGGFTTTTTPELEMTVAETNLDLGVLTSGTTATATTTFTVRSYLSSGYKVITIGNPPTSESGRQLATSASGTTSSAGTEFFGINLVDNSSPNIGSNVVDDPVDIVDPQSNQVVETFGYGAPMYTYSRANIFAYENGAEVAYSPSSSGKTTFTISYVYNISSITPAGLYTFNQSLVVVSTY